MMRMAPKRRRAKRQVAEIAIPQAAVAPNGPVQRPKLVLVLSKLNFVHS
jgi:hypothetical protein